MTCSGTSSSTTRFRPASFFSKVRSNFSAWPNVLGNPSKSQLLFEFSHSLDFSSVSISEMILLSGRRPPDLMIASASFPVESENSIQVSWGVLTKSNLFCFEILSFSGVWLWCAYVDTYRVEFYL